MAATENSLSSDVPTYDEIEVARRIIEIREQTMVRRARLSEIFNTIRELEDEDARLSIEVDDLKQAGRALIWPPTVAS